MGLVCWKQRRALRASDLCLRTWTTAGPTVRAMISNARKRASTMRTEPEGRREMRLTMKRGRPRVSTNGKISGSGSTPCQVSVEYRGGRRLRSSPPSMLAKNQTAMARWMMRPTDIMVVQYMASFSSYCAGFLHARRMAILSHQ
eukprot:2499881-Rhodomonas_salina.2